MVTRFVTVTEDQVRRAQDLHDPVAQLSRKELLVIQFTKLINYFRDQLAPEWGGGSDEHDVQSAETGLQQYLEDTDAYGASDLPCWLRKKRDTLPWGPDNFTLTERADADLGYPFEAYLTVGSAILTINQASRILSIDRMELLRVKCSLLIDRRVISHAIKEMLKPRPLWPRIRLKRGGKGRSYRFV
jgi:hypothetical protein